jgi:hippurate hydrolase
LGAKCSSVLATLDGPHPGPTVLLRGDMDALPMHEDTGLDFASEVDGAMHACGHDAHTAMLATAARVIAAHRDELHGRVLLMFQPGEEGFFGARIMIEEGLLEADPAAAGGAVPSAAFAIHQTAHQQAGKIGTKGGPLAASSDEIQIDVRGRGGHASAPHLALDPVPAACEMALALQTMVTRRVNVFDPAVVTIARIEAGTTNNVIPESAELLGTIRTVSEVTRERVLEGVRRVADGIATAHGAEASVELIRGYPVTSNDAGFAAFVLDTAREVLGAERVMPMRHPVMGSEDFSYVLQRVPGAMANLGTRPDSGEVYPNHSNRMLLNESALASGIAMHVAVALRFFERGGMIGAAAR